MIFSKNLRFRLCFSCNIIEGNYKLRTQDHAQSTYFKRRNPKHSEITFSELKNMSAEFLYNKVRMLSDPYPNAYIKTADGKKLIIKELKILE